jgi:hypothetical protein
MDVSGMERVNTQVEFDSLISRLSHFILDHPCLMVRTSVELALEEWIEGAGSPGTLVARGYASEILGEEVQDFDKVGGAMETAVV